eukprot:s2514_g10.t1
MAAPALVTPALALAESQNAGMNVNDGSSSKPQTPAFTDTLGKCTSYKHLGCLLAWWLVDEARWAAMDAATNSLAREILKSSVAGVRLSKRAKSATYPFREGELNEFIATFKTIGLKEAVSGKSLLRWAYNAWMFLAMFGLNFLSGSAPQLMAGRWAALEKQAATSIGAAVSRTIQRDSDFGAVTCEGWLKDMKSRAVSYSGEEVSTCHQLTWEQLESSLPPEEHGGSIDALSWVGPRTKEFLKNPKLLLRKPSDVVLPRMPGRVHVLESDRKKIALELVRRGICDWVPLSQVHEHDGVKILNGLFGVAKPTQLPDGRPVLRLIMNLTGSNGTQIQLEGGCTSLPGITSWQSIVMDQGESLSLYQSDMSSAFYLFRIPAIWKPFLAFNLVMDGAEINLDPHTRYAMACAVIPMGWMNSVGIMQEISEQLVDYGGLNVGNQIFRGRPLPRWFNEVLQQATTEDRTWFHVCLENFCAGERLLPGDADLKGKLCHDAAERAWSSAGVVSSAKKKVSAANQVTELGAEVSSDARTLGVSLEKLHRLAMGTLWLISQRTLNRKHIQIMVGRWIFALQFRRPAMSVFQNIWHFISGNEKVTDKLKAQVRSELLHMVLLSPLLHCHLGAGVQPHVVATDASQTGCAVGSSDKLTAEGVDYLQASNKLEWRGVATPEPILLISLFNGIGGCFRCYDLLGILPMGRIAVECDAGANRITSRRWPGTLFVTDIKAVTVDVVRSWSLAFLKVKEVHIWAGFPCTDLSSVKHGRLNLAGPNSSLFYEVPRVKSLVEQEFGNTVVVKYALENVASMDANAAQQISCEIGCVPYQLDPKDAVPMRRPRFAWVSEPLESTFHDIQVTPQKYWKEVCATADYPATSSWIEPGAAPQDMVLEDAGLTEKTKTRYYTALRKLLPYFERCENPDTLDDEISSWVKAMWKRGEPLLTIADGLCGLAYFEPWTKKRLPHSWKLYAVWRRIEVPARAPPLTEELVMSMAAFEVDGGRLEMASLMLLGFTCLLRTGELLQLTTADFALGTETGVCSLKNTKTGRRDASNEVVSITDMVTLETVPLLHFHERYKDTARLTWVFRYHDNFHGAAVLSRDRVGATRVEEAHNSKFLHPHLAFFPAHSATATMRHWLVEDVFTQWRGPDDRQPLLKFLTRAAANVTGT